MSIKTETVDSTSTDQNQEGNWEDWSAGFEGVMSGKSDEEIKEATKKEAPENNDDDPPKPEDNSDQNADDDSPEDDKITLPADEDDDKNKKDPPKSEKNEDSEDDIDPVIKAEAEAVQKRFDELKKSDEFKNKSDDEIKTAIAEEREKDLDSPISLTTDGIDDEKKPENTTSNEDTGTWTDVAKEMGLESELNEDSFDEFKDAVEKHYEDKIEKIKSENEDYSNLSKKQKDLLKYFKAYGEKGLEKFVNPVKEFDEYLAMGKNDLVKKELEMKKDQHGNALYNEQQIADKMVYYEEHEDERDMEYDKIRESVIAARSKTQQGLLDRHKQYEADEQGKTDKESQRQLQAIESAMKGKETFLDAKIDDSIRTYVSKEFKNGAVQEITKNPDLLAEFILFRKFGKDLVEKIKQKEFKKGLNKSQGKLYNLPLINGAKPKAGKGNPPSSAEGYGSWADGMDALGISKK